MPPRKSKKKKLTSISHGRPPTATKPSASLSAKATRTLIRSHHQLNKARAQAVAAGDEDLINRIDKEIAAHGGLESYQLASKQGQSTDRGGDSSKVLVEWLAPELRKLAHSGAPAPIKLLIGALSTQNACSKNRLFDVTRIDLHSQEEGILQQDFMERPIPEKSEDMFHVISLSLVLNYVPQPAMRGKMLQRTTEFLVRESVLEEHVGGFHLPCLFLVLPAPCVMNSRYFTEDRLKEIMNSLGYSLVERKETPKLVYYLWSYNKKPEPKMFKKTQLNPGKTRNNFTVTLG